MSTVYLLNRYFQAKNGFFNTATRTLQVIRLSSNKGDSSSSSSSSSSSDDETKVKQKLDAKKKSKDALDKLSNLLKTMTGPEKTASMPKLDLAQPLNKRKKPIKDDGIKKPQSPEKQALNAAKDVAELIGGDVKQTQSELLMKLLNTSKTDGNTNLTDVVKGMKIDQEPIDQSKAHQVRNMLQKTSDMRPKRDPRVPRSPRTEPLEKIDLFGNEPLGIFTQTDFTEGVENKTWNHLYQKDLKLAVTHPPSNYFQQMILWTEQKKVWKFPIDNEQGLEEEKEIYFTEHVFLEEHLEPWCPHKGPLRHFMELVCVGLSKNPYLTVEAKKEHIMWFKNYFESKMQLLKETGAIPEIAPESQKQIE